MDVWQQATFADHVLKSRSSHPSFVFGSAAMAEQWELNM